MSGIHALVFSKDRAMQLDAFLRSAKQHAPYKTVTVLQCVTEDWAHREAYQRVCDRGDFTEWWEENDGVSTFEECVREWVGLYERVVFHTDDDVWFRDGPDLDEFLKSRSSFAPAFIVSYRLGENTTYCHPRDRLQAVPKSFPWRWRDAGHPLSFMEPPLDFSFTGDFGYPLSLNATAYRATDIEPLLDFTFANPTELETGLAARAERFTPEWMTAPAHSCCVSLPHNVVSASSQCPRGPNPDWQPDTLAEKYLDGWRIALDRMDFSHVIGAHQEIPLEFTRAA
jgi:hypothetical protein